MIIPKFWLVLAWLKLILEIARILPEDHEAFVLSTPRCVLTRPHAQQIAGIAETQQKCQITAFALDITLFAQT